MPGGLLFTISRQPRGVSSCHNISNVSKHNTSRLDVHVCVCVCATPCIHTYICTIACRETDKVNLSHDRGPRRRCDCSGSDRTVFSGDHPFECEYCGSCFRDDGTLRGHKRIHTGEKPYECNGCGKRFSLKHQLETHYRVHTGESSGGGQNTSLYGSAFHSCSVTFTKNYSCFQKNISKVQLSSLDSFLKIQTSFGRKRLESDRHRSFHDVNYFSIVAIPHHFH